MNVNDLLFIIFINGIIHKYNGVNINVAGDNKEYILVINKNITYIAEQLEIDIIKIEEYDTKKNSN